MVNLARKLHLDAETALHRATAKFSKRFRAVERLARERQLTLEKALAARARCAVGRGQVRRAGVALASGPIPNGHHPISLIR
ncbi:MAG: hypothetical protein ACH37Z_18655 [Anaerolineae bacterium]